MTNVLSRIGSTIASWFGAQRTVGFGKGFFIGTREVYPEITSTTAIVNGFNGNTAVYSIVKKDAKKFGSVPRYLEKPEVEKKAQHPERVEGPLMDLLNQPNPYQSQDAFLSLVRAYYKVCGEAFIWLNRGNTDTLIGDELITIDDTAQMKKPVLEMYVLPSNKVIVVPDPENIFGVFGYILESGIRVPIRKVDMIHWKDINLDFDITSKPMLRGRSPLASGFKTLEQNNSATDSAVRMYQNDGAKGVLANKTLANMSAKQETDLRAVVDKKINNIDVKGAVAALQGDWSYMDISKDSVDMELLKGKEMSMKELCFLFGLPYELFDSGVTWSNKEMAQKGWVINEIIPDCKQLDGELSRVLTVAFGYGKEVKITSDFDDLAELQEDMAKKIEWLTKGPYSPNEIREATGYEPSDEEGADKIMIPSGLVPLEADDGGDDILAEIDKMRSNGVNGTGNNGTNKKPIPERS